MPQQDVHFGLTLPNRGVIIGATTVDEMLALAQKAEDAGWDSGWVGDSIFAKPRLDSLVLLGALAARTKRVKLGPACFVSTPLRNALLLAWMRARPRLPFAWSATTRKLSSGGSRTKCWRACSRELL